MIRPHLCGAACLVAAMFNLDLTTTVHCAVSRGALLQLLFLIAATVPRVQQLLLLIVQPTVQCGVCRGPSHHLHTPSVAFSPDPAPPLQMVVWYSGCKVRALALLSVLYVV